MEAICVDKNWYKINVLVLAVFLKYTHVVLCADSKYKPTEINYNR